MATLVRRDAREARQWRAAQLRAGHDGAVAPRHKIEKKKSVRLTNAPLVVGPNGTCNLCVLAPTGTSLILNGTGNVSTGSANAVVDSSGTPAVSVTSSGGLQAASVGVVGTVSTPSTGKVSNLTTGITAVADPLALLPTPTVTVPVSVPSVTLTGTTSQTISPGVYASISVSGGASLTMNAGTYVILQQFSTAGTAKVTASAVSLYLACSAYPTPCASNQAGASLHLASTGTFSLTAPVASCSPFLIVSDRNNTSPIVITGTASDRFVGVVYAKSAPLTVTALNSTFTMGSQLVVGDATFSGSAVTISGTPVYASISLAGPTASSVVGAPASVQASFFCIGKSVANALISFTATGVNPTTGGALTNASGVATFNLTSSTAGTDQVVAAFTVGGSKIASNSVSVNWTTPIEPVATTSVTGQFYNGGCGAFCGNVADPLWTQSFPTIDFNPPGGSIPGNISGVNVDTRPFTDVTTNAVGDFTGNIVAQGGNGLQAGVGGLNGFDATFTATMVVAQAGDQTFNFYDDDGFIVGIAGGATRVSGTLVNPPAATELDGYPVMGAYNDPTSPAGHQVTVDFPSAGVYPYEVDYSECCGGQLALTMATSSGEGVPPAGNLSITPVNVPNQNIGQAVQLTVAAMDDTGLVIPNLPVTMTVSGPNEQTLTGTTGSNGLAVLSYVGNSPGTDLVIAGASVAGMPATSNTVPVTWVYGSGSSSSAPPPIITNPMPPDGSVVTSPVPVTAAFTASVGQTITSWSVTYQGSSAAGPTTLASGSGSPPSTLGTFDPTLLPNGTYTITISATDSGGGSQILPVTVAVAGNLKLGRYVTIYQDLSVPVNGFQMTVDRTYDSTNKQVGDFGVGWHVSLSNFIVSTNRQLGAGGWTEYPTSCIFGLCFWGFKTSTPHFVTVTWPDGHAEVFNFTPSGGEALLYAQGTAAYTAVPNTGTTSTLQPMPADAGVNNGFDGNLYGGSGAIYNPTEFLLTTHDGEQIVVSTQTGLVSETDPNGNSLSVDSNGIQASNGEGIVYQRDGQGRITQITGPSGQKMTYTYSASGDLAGATDPNGNTTTYDYDTNHNLLDAKGPGGQPLQKETYGPDGRLATITDADGNTTNIANSVAGEQQIVTDPNGKLSTIYTYDNVGDLIRQDQVFSGQTLTDTYTYDADGHLLVHVDPLGHTTTSTYDPAGDVTSFTDANGHTTSYTYNSLGEMTAETGSGGQSLATATYDGNGNLTVMSLPGSTESYTYGTDGNVSSVTDGLSHTQTYGYDALGHIDKVTDASGNTSFVSSDANGNTTSITDPVGNTTGFGYDADGNLTSTTDPDGNIRSFTHNPLEQLTTETDGDGHTTTFTYDGNGNLTKLVNRDGQTVSYSYDADGRILQMAQPSGTTTFTYDPAGRMATAADPDGTLAFGYDAANRIVLQTSGPTATSLQPTATISYTYDPAGNRLTATDAAGTTKYSYDSLSRLTTLTDPSGGVFGFGYDGASQLSTLSRPNGVNDALSYDAAGNLTARVAVDGPTTLARATYTYTPTNLRSSETTLSGTSNYTYDLTSQLTGATHPAAGPAAESYTYDPAGNRTSSASEALGQFNYDSANRLMSDAHYTYTYNNEGDLTSRTSKAGSAKTTYVWNALHQLTAIHFADGTTTTYRYDALGRRIEINANGQITRDVYDGSNIALEYNASNVLQASYTNGLGTDSVLEMVRGGHPYYYVQDGQNSTTALTNSTGTVVDSYTYDAFGNQTSTGTVANPFTYTGREYDPKSGLYYYRSRYYDPSTGRFLSEDSVLSTNSYPYANSDPTNLNDPTGAEAEVESAILSVYNDDLTRARALQKLTACIAGQLLFGVLAMGGSTQAPPDEGALVTGAFQNWFISFLPDQLQGAATKILNPDDVGAAGDDSGQQSTLDKIKETASDKIKDTVKDKVEGKAFNISGLPDGSQDFVDGLKSGYDLDQQVAQAAQAAADGDPGAGKLICALCHQSG